MTPRLIGGEMMVWSDLDGKHGPAPARSATLRPLLAAAYGRTLIAGPHDPSLIASLRAASVRPAPVPAVSDPIRSGQVVSDPVGSGQVASGQVASDPIGSGRVASDPIGSGRVASDPIGTGRAASVPVVSDPFGSGSVVSVPVTELTLLVRGLPDADLLADRFPAATVLCGSLDKLAAAPAFDTVIALDGLSRLRSAEDDTSWSWADDLARLVSVLAPGGRLLLGLENLFGLHRILAPPPSPTDGDWGGAVDEYDNSRPASSAQLKSALGALGLQVRASFAAFPAPGDPSLLLSTELLADRSVRGWATAAIRTAFAPADPAGSVSPVRSLGPVRSAGSFGPAQPDSAAGVAHSADPAGLVRSAGSFGPAQPASAADLAGSVELGGSAKLAGLALADPARIAAGALRAGIGAELANGWFVLAQGGSGESLPELPVAVVGENASVSAVADLPAGPTLDELLLAASLRRDMPALRELLTGWQSGTHAGVPADRIVVAPDGIHTPLAPAGPPGLALAALAGAMIREGHAYLWPAPADQPELTALLAAMAGREAAEIPPLPSSPASGLRELLIERDRLTRELTEARARHEWYEGMLLEREAELKRVRRINTMLMATMPGKAAKASYGGLRAAKRALRKLKG